MILPTSFGLLGCLLICSGSLTFGAPASPQTNASPNGEATGISKNVTGPSNLGLWPPTPLRRDLELGELVITSLGVTGNQAEFNAFTNMLSMLQTRLKTLQQGSTFYFLSPRVFMMGLASLSLSATVEMRSATLPRVILDSVAEALNLLFAEYGLRELTGEVRDDPDVGDNSIKVSKGRATKFNGGYDHLFAAMASTPGVMLEFQEGPTPLSGDPGDRETALNVMNDFIAHVSSNPMASFDQYTASAIVRGWEFSFEMKADHLSQITNERAQKIAQDIQSIISGFPPASFGADIRQLLGREMKLIGGVRFDKQRAGLGANNGTDGIIFSK